MGIKLETSKYSLLLLSAELNNGCLYICFPVRRSGNDGFAKTINIPEGETPWNVTISEDYFEDLDVQDFLKTSEISTNEQAKMIPSAFLILVMIILHRFFGE